MHITGLDILTADVGSPGAPRVYVFVRVQTDEGISGIGEPSCVGKEQAVVGAVRDLEHLVLGADPLAIELVMTRTVIWRTGPVLSAAVSGIEHALWDIKSKALGVPVWQLLGGRVRDRRQRHRRRTAAPVVAPHARVSPVESTEVMAEGGVVRVAVFERGAQIVSGTESPPEVGWMFARIPLVRWHYCELMQTLLQQVPEIGFLKTLLDDSGFGFEYTASLYPGRNVGPYVVREWRPAAEIAEKTARNVIRYWRGLRDAARQARPDFVLIAGLKNIAEEQGPILDGIDAGIDLQAESQRSDMEDPEWDETLRGLRSRGSQAWMEPRPKGSPYLLGVPCPWLTAQRLRHLADADFDHVDVYCDAVYLAPYDPNREVIAAFQLGDGTIEGDDAPDIDSVVSTASCWRCARLWAGDTDAQRLVAAGHRPVHGTELHLVPFLGAALRPRHERHPRGGSSGVRRDDADDLQQPEQHRFRRRRAVGDPRRRHLRPPSSRLRGGVGGLGRSTSLTAWPQREVTSGSICATACGLSSVTRRRCAISVAGSPAYTVTSTPPTTRRDRGDARRCTTPAPASWTTPGTCCCCGSAPMSTLCH